MEGKYVVYIMLDIYPCATGGMEIYYNNLLPEIARHKKVLLITCCNKIKDTNYQIEYISKKLYSIPGTTRIATLLFTALKLIKYRAKISVVHYPYASNAGRWGYVLPFLKKYFRINYVLQLHGGGMGKWKAFSGNKLLFKHASKLIAVSDVIKKEYQKRSRQKVELIYPLVPFKTSNITPEELKIETGFAKNDKIILFVGSLKEIKAPNILLDAFIKLGKEYVKENKLKLVFIGTGNLQEQMESQIKNTDLHSNVTFNGLTPYEKVPNYYKIADIYVITSHFEGTPKSLLEAMFNKLPIIGTNVNGINNVLKPEIDALLFEKDNSTELANQLRRLINNEDLCQKLSNSSNQIYEQKYSFDITLNSLLKLYKDF